jgi:hypothetical protein
MKVSHIMGALEFSKSNAVDGKSNDGERKSNNTTAGEAACIMKSPAARPLYALAVGARRIDISEQISVRLDQLVALLSMTYGEQGEAFRNMPDHVQDNFMWNCLSMAEEVCELVQVEQGMEEGAGA